MAGSCFLFQYQGNRKKSSEKNELLVFRLLAQVLSAKLSQRFMLVLQKILLEPVSENVVQSVFEEGLERFKKNSKYFFFSFQLVSAQRWSA